MTFTEAVGLAKAGNEAGFTYLYEQTYKKSFYVAKKYMKNDDTEAEDVLQIAYVKAFSNLGQLEDPEKFQGWFSRIVANTSFRELQKKTPTLFSQMNDEDTDIKFEDTIENSNVDFQPEASIDGKETQRLVKEMLDTLSDEQRMCVMMYYYEDIPVKDEALILGVSENTVKSRLNYGRKAIKEKVLDLEKRGPKLYGILPIGFFIYLLKQDAAAATPLAGLAGISGIIGSSAKEAKTGIHAGASNIAGKAASSAAKAAIHVKVTIGVVAAVCAVTGATVAVKNNSSKYTDNMTQDISEVIYDKQKEDQGGIESTSQAILDTSQNIARLGNNDEETVNTEETMSTEETTAASTAASDVSESDKKEAAEEEASVIMLHVYSTTGRKFNYDPEDNECFGDCIYCYTLLYPEQCKETERIASDYSLDPFPVDKAVVEQVAAGLFTGCKHLLPIPADYQRTDWTMISVYSDRYMMGGSDPFLYDCKLQSWEENGDGTYTAKYAFYDEGMESCAIDELFTIGTITYCDNTYSVGGAKPLLPISVISAEFQDI